MTGETDSTGVIGSAVIITDIVVCLLLQVEHFHGSGE